MSETTTRQGVSYEKWVNYSRRVDILSTLMATVLTMCAENPMIAPAVGPDFVKEAREAAETLIRLRDEAQDG